MENYRVIMAMTYDGINYFPMSVNFNEENAIEVIEAKHGIKGTAIVLKLLCKIYKEGYYISWGEEQCIIFANKMGREVKALEVKNIVSILCDKGVFHLKSFVENHVLTSETIQKVWIEATKRRKRDLNTLPYMLNKPIAEERQPQPADANSVVHDVSLTLPNVLRPVAFDAENADNFGQSKVNDSRTKERTSPSAPPRGKEGQKEAFSLPSPPGYAFNTNTHNYTGLMETLERLGVTDSGELNAILRLSDYGRKGTVFWKLIGSTCWNNIGAKGRYIIAALNKDKHT